MSKIRIFILDDDRFYGALIQHALRREDRELTYFPSEKECMEALKDPPEILILDHHLEHSTGFQIMEYMDQFDRPKPAIVYLSSQEHVHVAIQALQKGAANYLEKGEGVLEELKQEIDRIARHTKNFLRPFDRRKYQLQYLKC